MKRILSLLLAVCLLSSVCAFSVETNAVNDSGSCGDGVFWKYDTDTCTLTISGNGEMTDYDVGQNNGEFVTTAPWKTYYNEMKTVVIEDGVTSIGKRAFHMCDFTTIIIGKSVESIGDFAFSWCTSLAEIVVSDDNTAYSSQDGILFNKNKKELIQYPIGNSRMEYIIPNSVTTISKWAFSNSYNLVSVTIPDSVVSIGEHAFADCYHSLTVVIIGRSVTHIGKNAFRDCYSLTDVYYTGTEVEWNSILTDSGNNCLINATIHFNTNPIEIDPGTCGNGVRWNYDTGSCILTIHGEGRMRDYATVGIHTTTAPWKYYYDNMKAVVIDNGVTGIGAGAFWGCGLTSVIIEDSVESIGETAFYECFELTDVYYTGTEAEWGKIIIESDNDCLLNATIHFNYVPDAPAVIPGDISGDGKVNVADALLMKKIIIGVLNSVDYIDTADLNSDGKINAVDSLTLIRIILGSDS